MEKKTGSLLFRFGIIFLIFTVITLMMCGASIYLNQTAAYKAQCEDTVKKIAAHLEHLVMADGKNFTLMQDFFMEHMDELMISHDFNGDWHPARKRFDHLFGLRYPGRTLGVNIEFEELDHETQQAFALYVYEYWLHTFEKAMDTFGVAYAYYVVPLPEPLFMCYMIDPTREKREIGGLTYLDLGDNVYEPYNEHQKMWEAWNTGTKPAGHDTYDNEYGQTYAYYIPLWIEGRKMGVIGIDIDIATVNEGILRNTLQQVAGMGAILALCVAAMLWFIHRQYIAKLSRLQSSVRAYAATKDVAIARAIEKDGGGDDEISSLAMQTATMILELENYMKSLVATTKELTDTKEQAARMNELAMRDALTGIRNKTAYDSELRKLAREMAAGLKEFGIAMIDLNFLKRINDTYGHEQGNVAIKKLCRLVCVTFAHSPVFRIGGDEFVAILKNDDYRNITALEETFNQELEKLAADDSLEPWEKISAALGYAFFDPATDSGVENVFKRADKAMYARKKEMKAVRIS